MKLTKENLEDLYDKMSLDQMSEHLNIAKSTLYYHMRKLGVKRRSKSEAQKHHLKKSPHQRTGKKHSEETKQRISVGTREFWDSDNGEEQRKKLGELRKTEWKKRSAKQRSSVLNKLQSASRPSAGELSNFGKKFSEFLSDRESVQTCIQIVPNHYSDIILNERKIVIELLLPISVYGTEQQHKLNSRYEKLASQLQDAGYRVVIVEDKSNSVSNARCSRLYDELLKFFENTDLQRMTIVS